MNKYKNLSSLSIGEKLRFFRLKNKMTLEEVGTRIGKTGSAISYYEAGKRVPAPDVLVKLCKLYNVSNVSVFYGDVELPPDAIFSAEERQLVAMWRELSQEQQQALLVLIKGLTGL